MSDIRPSATLATCAAAEKIFSKLKRNSSGEKNTNERTMISSRFITQ